MSDAALENVRWLAATSPHETGAMVPPRAPRQAIASVGILGAGQMGAAIAAAHVLHRMPVVVLDADPVALRRAFGSIAAELRADGAHLSPERIGRLVHPTSDLAKAARCDLVLECIAENLSEKRRLFSALWPLMGPRTLLATNTSTIPLERLSEGCPDPLRLCGLHFCHPARQRPLVEVVRGRQTGDATIAAALDHVRRIGRLAIVVEDGPGFVVNRLLFPYLGEALRMAGEGVPLEAIDRAAVEFGMAWGPIRMIDEIGLDTVLRAAWVLAEAFPDRIGSSPLLVALVKAGRLGRKSGAGFFAYEGSAMDDAPGRVDAEVQSLIARWIEPASDGAPSTMAERLVLPMVLEASRILDEGKARSEADVDRAALFGLGFPADKGGLLWWADQQGAARLAAMSDMLGMPTAPRLRAMAREGGCFYRASDPARTRGRSAIASERS